MDENAEIKWNEDVNRAVQIMKVKKRNGEIVSFTPDKILTAVFKAAQSVGGSDIDEATRLSTVAITGIVNDADEYEDHIINVEEIQDAVEKTLISEGHAKTAKAFILYREQHRQDRELRDISSLNLDDVGLDDPVSKKLGFMFKHKTKLLRVVEQDMINDYRTLLLRMRKLQKLGELPLHPVDYLEGFELASNIYRKKYYLKDIDGNAIEERPEDVFARISAFVSTVEETDKKQFAWAKKFYEMMYNGYFMAGGRVIAGAGDLYRLKTLSNCFVTLIKEDNIESIYNSAYDCARTYSYGGGIGVDISVLRPRDAVVHNAADKSTGAVSFMELYSLTTGLIGQSGRRGALMLTIDVKHPDTPYFIQVKKNPNWVTNQIVEQCKWSNMFDDKQLDVIKKQVMENTQVRFANISLKVSDEFMQAVEEGNRHGMDKILVYRKDKDVDNGPQMQDYDSIHYSYEIPSKPIEKYSLLGAFDDVDQLNNFLEENRDELTEKYDFSKEMLDIPDARDTFGDFIIEGKDYDFAVRYSGDFMLYFNSSQTDEIKRLIKARDVWNKFVEGNYKTAEPGLIFWTKMSKYSPSNYLGRNISATNPCGEVPLESGGACNLTSINLSRMVVDGYTDQAHIDLDLLMEVTRTAVRFLDNVITWNERLNPLEEQRDAAKFTRRIGLGIIGIADMLNQLGYGYDSDEGIKIIEDVMKFIADKAYEASAILSEEKGPNPIFNYDDYAKSPFFQESISEETRELVKEKGLRNTAILSIAPTGTISNIILSFKEGEKHYIGASGGVEPIFALYYTRRSESFGNKFFRIFHSTVQAYLDKKGLAEKAKDISEDELREILPDHFFRTAHNISPDRRVVIQGVCQKYIDQSISSTVNLPEDVDPETISNIYIDSWRKGLKGITIYREGSRFPILQSDTKATEFTDFKEKKFRIKGKDGSVFEGKGDEVITLPNGKLTTIYHLIKHTKGGSKESDEKKDINDIQEDQEEKKEVEQEVVNSC